MGIQNEAEGKFLNHILDTSLPADEKGKGLQRYHLLPYSTQALTLEYLIATSKKGHVLKCLARFLAMIGGRTNPDIFAMI